MKPRGVDGRLRVEIEHGDVARSADGDRLPPGRFEQPRRVPAQPRDQRRQRQVAGPHQPVQHHRHRRLEPDDAEGGTVELALLLGQARAGAWSVAMQSMVPSASPSINASTSRLVRSGGCIFVLASQLRTASSVRTRWCGVTSAVTRTPRAFASRTSRTAPAVDDVRDVHVGAGQLGEQDVARHHHVFGGGRLPGRPSSVETTPSFMAAPRAQGAVLGVADDRRAEGQRVLHGAAVERRRS